MEKQYQSQNKTFIIHSQNHYFIMIHFLMVQIEGFLRVVTSTPKLLIPPLFFFNKTLHYYSFLSPFFPFPVPLQFLHILFPFIFSLCFSLQTIIAKHHTILLPTMTHPVESCHQHYHDKLQNSFSPFVDAT